MVKAVAIPTVSSLTRKIRANLKEMQHLIDGRVNCKPILYGASLEDLQETLDWLLKLSAGEYDVAFRIWIIRSEALWAIMGRDRSIASTALRAARKALDAACRKCPHLLRKRNGRD